MMYVFFNYDNYQQIVNGTSHGFSSDHMNQILEHLDHLSFITDKGTEFVTILQTLN